MLKVDIDVTLANEIYQFQIKGVSKFIIRQCGILLVIVKFVTLFCLYVQLIRFRICTICSDETGFIPVVFPDEEIQRLIGKDVYEVENDNCEVQFNIVYYIVSLRY